MLALQHNPGHRRARCDLDVAWHELEVLDVDDEFVLDDDDRRGRHGRRAGGYDRRRGRQWRGRRRHGGGRRRHGGGRRRHGSWRRWHGGGRRRHGGGRWHAGVAGPRQAQTSRVLRPGWSSGRMLPAARAGTAKHTAVRFMLNLPIGCRILPVFLIIASNRPENRRPPRRPRLHARDRNGRRPAICGRLHSDTTPGTAEMLRRDDAVGAAGTNSRHMTAGGACRKRRAGIPRPPGPVRVAGT